MVETAQKISTRNGGFNHIPLTLHQSRNIKYVTISCLSPHTDSLVLSPTFRIFSSRTLIFYSNSPPHSAPDSHYQFFRVGKINDTYLPSLLQTKKHNKIDIFNFSLQEHLFIQIIQTIQMRLRKMAEEQDGKTTFSLTNSSKEHFNAEQTLQNNFCRLAEDIRQPEKQTIVFKNRQEKI